MLSAPALVALSKWRLAAGGVAVDELHVPPCAGRPEANAKFSSGEVGSNVDEHGSNPTLGGSQALEFQPESGSVSFESADSLLDFMAFSAATATAPAAAAAACAAAAIADNASTPGPLFGPEILNAASAHAEDAAASTFLRNICVWNACQKRRDMPILCAVSSPTVATSSHV